MNLELAKKKLQKINSLIDTFEPGDSSVSLLECDLLKNYTREFYDALISPADKSGNGSSTEPIRQKSVTHSPVKEKPAPPERPVAREKAPEPTREQQDRERLELQSEREQFQPLPEREEKPAKENLIAEERKEAAVATVEAKRVSEPAESRVKVVESSRADKSPETYDLKPEIKELFKIKKAHEISEKLSQLPITDLNKAMGVNERIFVKNELFNGDDLFFKQTIKKLNEFENYDQAKFFLSREVADQLDWGNPDKIKKAKNFIQLVYRRYKSY